MHIFDVFYNKYYPLTLLNRKRARKRNHKKNISILCGNCMGGYIYHQLGLQFNSPTINLMMLQTDLFKLVSNLEFYRRQEFQPCEGGGYLADIRIFFTHYKSFEDGVKKWHSRFKRINYDELYIIASDRDGLSEEQIRQYANVRCKKLVIFTAKDYDLPYCFQLKQYSNQPSIGNILSKTISGKWLFERYFDYVGWLNSADPIAEHFRID